MAGAAGLPGPGPDPPRIDDGFRGPARLSPKAQPVSPQARTPQVSRWTLKYEMWLPFQNT